MLTDGFLDQFGGEVGGKYSLRRFKDLIQTIHDEPTIKQRELIEKSLDGWTNNKYEQIDDITLLGFKIVNSPF